MLTSTQERFLAEFFRLRPTPFYLSGGTALAGYYLHHRFSDDLDFFTRDVENLRSAAALVARAAEAAGLTVDRIVHRGELVQAFLSGDRETDRPLVKVECVTDTPPYFAEPRDFSPVMVADVLCIAVSKTAIHTRFEPKDYVDLYLVVRELGYRMEDLISRAKEKMIGLDDLTIAARFDKVDEVLDAVRKFSRAYMLVSVDESEMVLFYKDWARRLFEQSPPEMPRREDA